MIASKSNVAQDATITITPQSPTQLIDVIVDRDYSSTYTDVINGQTVIDFEFTEPKKIEYIAIGGSNICTLDRLAITIATTDGFQQTLVSSDGFTLVTSDGFTLGTVNDPSIDDSVMGLDESRVLMYQIDEDDVLGVKIQVFGNGTLSIAEIAMGEKYEIPNGPQGGYFRPYTDFGEEARSAKNLNAAPISQVYQSRSVPVTLQINNLLNSQIAEWLVFSKFASTNTFYILDDDDKFHSYACFNADIKAVSNHSQTRDLGNVMLKFDTLSRTENLIL